MDGQVGLKVTEQASRVAGRCSTCTKECDQWVVQLIRANRLRWESEYSCDSCGTILHDGDWGAAPESIRTALIAEHGEYLLSLKDDNPSPGRVLKAFRDAFDISLSEAKSASDSVRSTGFHGTRVEVELVKRLLAVAAINSIITASPGGSATPTGPTQAGPEMNFHLE